MDELESGIEIAVRAAGSATELARRLGLTQQAVSCWVIDQRIPPLRVLDVERVTGVSRRLLAPELFTACPNCDQ